MKTFWQASKTLLFDWCSRIYINLAVLRIDLLARRDRSSAIKLSTSLPFDSMDKPQTTSRRKFLTGSAVVVGGVGVACAITPFLSSWKPSKKARAAGSPVEVDIAQLQQGQMITVEWRGRPIAIVRRSEVQLQSLRKVQDLGLLRDPDSNESEQPATSKNNYRSLKPEFLVTIGICTHLGCAPLYRPDKTDAVLGDDWQGGFFCPCHGSKFDLAGRVYKSVPANTNLVIPPYRFTANNTLIVGEEEQA